jgi:N-acetyl-gamma-glutamyl-phosphate reductase
VVTVVEPGKLFDYYDIGKGYVITKINGVALNSVADIEKAFSTYYKDQPMIQFGSLKSRPQLASLKKVVGTNNTHISYTVDDQKLYVFSVIDNLVKGAAGQAIENMNKKFDYPVDMGLSQLEALQ